MNGASFRHQDFADRFLRSRSLATRAIEFAGVVFLVAGSATAIWGSPQQLEVPFLLAGIGCFSVLGYLYLMGILAELSYIREKLLKETPQIEID